MHTKKYYSNPDTISCSGQSIVGILLVYSLPFSVSACLSASFKDTVDPRVPIFVSLVFMLNLALLF